MPSRVSDLIGRARRRAVWNLVFEQTTVGTMAGLGGAILLLLVGTQILDWYWLVLLFVTGAGLSGWRTRAMLPSPYRVAQSVDRRLGLHDTLSTAFHFSAGAPGAAGPILDLQRADAERTADGVDPALAIPWRLPRYFYPSMALAAAVAGLFFLRYTLRGTLDLRAPLVEAVADFFHPNQVIARAKKPPRLPGEEPLTLSLDPSGQRRPELDAAPDEALNQTDTPDVNVALDSKESLKARQNQMKAQGDIAEEGESAEEGERGQGDNGKNNGEGKESAGQDKGSPQNAKQGNGADQSSLMDKMRDAMANLMAKLKIPNQPGANQRANAQKGNQQAGQREQGGGQKGERGQGNPQGKGAPSDDPEAEGQAQGEQQAQAGQGKGNERGEMAGDPNQSKSGMGKQDGSKDLQDAEQLAAMGKISEIFGKRAQNISGEVMVEVTSSKHQQLRTAYTQRTVAHREAGGEIHRDEVPQDFQHYVQQYFEQVRKAESEKPPK